MEVKTKIILGVIAFIAACAAFPEFFGAYRKEGESSDFMLVLCGFCGGFMINQITRNN